MGIPKVILFNGIVPVLVSKGGGPVVVVERVVETPDRVEVPERPDPVVEVKGIVCEVG